MYMYKARNLVLTLLIILFSGACTTSNTQYKKAAANPLYLHQSVKRLTYTIINDIFNPPVAARIYAYSSIAAYEAARPGYPDYTSLSGQLRDLTLPPQPDSSLEYCFPLAGTVAFNVVAKNWTFSEDTMTLFRENLLETYKKLKVPGEVFDRSVEYGEAVAQHIIEWSNNDNYKQTRTFPKHAVKESPEAWKPTPPAYMEAIEPHWNKIRPMTLDSAQQFKPVPVTPFSKEKNSDFYKETEEVYTIGKGLTDEQKWIADFWDCNPFALNVIGHVNFAVKKITPGGHWIAIAGLSAEQIDADYMKTAEAYALTSIALMDGFIACWDEKYRSNLVRPETFINAWIDPEWRPYLQTPPFPEYTSGHSVISNASAVVLTRIFGDNFAFNDSTEIEFGVPVRSFTSFIQAAEEASLSRLYGGIHYRPGMENGMQQGRMVGEHIAAKLVTNKKTLAKK